MSSTTYHVRYPSRARVLNLGKTLSSFQNFILISILYIKNTNKDDIWHGLVHDFQGERD